MISSETDIANLALGHLGEGSIQSMDGDTMPARACALHYDSNRDATLRAHRWNFAVTRVELSELADAPLFGWEHQFELPGDCLRVLEFNDSEEGDWITAPYIIEGRKLLTDADTAELVYVKRVTDVSQFDSLFVEALALRLAVKLTESIRGTTGKTAELTEAYERLVAPLARRIDANEGRRRKGLLFTNSLAIRARYGAVAFP